MRLTERKETITLPASALPFGNPLPSADDRQIANQLRRVLAAQKAGEAVLRVMDPDITRSLEITLTPTMTDLFLKLLRHIGSGDAVTLVPIQQILTTQQAADLLNVSRPYLIRLLEDGEIAFTTVGSHRRIKAEDVFAYKDARDRLRSDALNEIFASGADLY